MIPYLDIVKKTIYEGKWKENRTGIRTLTIPNAIFSHEMSNGFPLLTTKKMPIKTIAVELEGFIKGITSKKWYQDRNCHIWDEWANPTSAKSYFEHHKNMAGYPEPLEYTSENKKISQKLCDDLGPIYGYQWRRFGQAYDENDNGVVEQYDQFKTILDTLRNNLDDRRMVCSAWNPIQIEKMALPPCHMLWGLVHIDGTLNMYWVQRSCDLMLGVPFNIASYGMLLTLLCEYSGLKPGNLTGLLADCHIYENQLNGAIQQLDRLPKTLPGVYIDSNAPFDILKWTHQDIHLIDYNSHEKINFGDVAV